MHKFAYSCPAIFVCMLVACTGGNDAKTGTSDGEGGTGGEQDSGGNGEGGQSVSGGNGGKAAVVTGGNGGSTATGGTAGMSTGGATNNAGGSGGSAGSAGKPGGTGGAPSAGGAPGGTVAVECSKLANCDTFESYTTAGKPAGPWTGFETPGGTLAVDETRGFGGSKKSIKITVNPGGDMTARMRHMGSGLLPADELYMRMMVWMDAPPKGSGHWNWMWGEGNVSQKSGGKLSDAFIASGGNLNGGTTWMLYGGGASGGYQDCWAQAQTKLPVGRWACYEFHQNSKTNSGDSWIDGKLDEIVGFQDAQPLTGQCLPGNNFTNGLWYIPKVEKAFFGWKMYHTLSGTATAWLDDIAISTKRIGCPAP